MSSAIATRLPSDHPSQAISETTAIVQMIERAAVNPAVDLDKLERLMKMREQVEAKKAETAFNVAMKNAQAAMGRVAADASNPQTKSRYATYAALDRILRPIYTQHGFSLSFDEDDSPKPEHVRIVCYVSHEDGHTRTYRKDMPADGKGAKGNDVMTKTHATGAAASYGMRYLLKGVFNVAVGDDDRDGNAPAEPRDTISDTQVSELRRLIAEVGADEPKLLKFLRLERLDDIFADRLEQVRETIEQKRGRR